jgi:hypothetical protein
LSAVFSMNGGITPISTALATRAELYRARYRVTSPVPMENPPSIAPVRSRCSSKAFRSAAKVS